MATIDKDSVIDTLKKEVSLLKKETTSLKKELNKIDNLIKINESNTKKIKRINIIIDKNFYPVPETKKSIAKAFRAEVTDQYGMAEGCGNFSQCELGRYHLDFEMGFPEFIDMSENPNSNIKHLVFTSLSNIAMPLIRYDTGDLVIPTNEKCNCGRKSIVVERIVGREEDYILTPEGNKASKDKVEEFLTKLNKTNYAIR